MVLNMLLQHTFKVIQYDVDLTSVGGFLVCLNHVIYSERTLKIRSLIKEDINIFDKTVNVVEHLN